MRISRDASALLDVVYLASMDHEREARDLAQAVNSQLSDLRVRLQLAWATPRADTVDAWLVIARQTVRGGQALAVFWTSRNRLHLAFVQGRDLRLLIRDLGGTGGGERVESMALILRTALSAYLKGARLPAARVPEVPGAPSLHPTLAAHATSQPARRRTVWAQRPPRLALELGYAVEAWSGAVPPLHGAAAALTWRFSRRFSARLGARWMSGVTLRSVVPDDPVRARLSRYPVFLAARVQTGWRRFNLGAEVAVQLEYLRVRIGPSALVLAGDDRGDLRWALEPALYLAARVVSRLRIHLRFAAEIILRYQEFGYATNQGAFVSFGREWPVKPRAELGLTVDLW